MIPFGEYLPDLPIFENPGALEAKNVLPDRASYRPMRALVAASNTISAQAQGFFSAVDSGGNTNLFVGIDDAMLHTTGVSFTAVTRISTATASTIAYTTGATGGWDFARFGDRIVAVNGTDDPQTFIMASSTEFTALTTDLRGFYCATVRDFMVFGDTFDGSDGTVKNRVRWSAIGDPTSWTVNATTQADFQDLYGSPSGGGDVMRMVGGEYGIVFQQRSIWRMQYIGPPTVFQFDEVLPGYGTQAPWSVAQLGRMVFFLGENGFYQLLDGSQLIPIGTNKVDKTFYGEVDQSRLYRIYGQVDPINKLVMWAYPTEASVNGHPNRMLIYDYVNGRWARAEYDLELLARALSAGYTLDGLDAVSSSIDALGFSLDSRVWVGGSPSLAAWKDNRLSFFTGDIKSAMIDTTEAQIFPDHRAFVREVRPGVQGGATPLIQLGTRNRIQDDVTFSATVTVNADGFAPVRSDGRYHRVRVTLPTASSWTHAHGVELVARRTGRR